MTELLEFGWKSGLIALLGLGLAAVMGRFRPAVRHGVLFCSLMLCLIVPIAARFGPQTYVEIPVLAEATVSPAMVTPSRPESSSPKTVVKRTARRPMPDGLPVTVVYGLGVVAVSLRYAVGFLRLRRISGRSQAAPDEIQRVGTALGSSMPVHIAIAAKGDIPCALTAGIFRPIIFLPEESVSWSPQRLAMVLRHELAHVQRRDPVSQLLAECVVALYWFNPSVWLGARAMRGYAELAADEAVLLAGIRPTDYAQDLLLIARQMGMGARWTLGPELLLMKNKRIETRLKSILSPAARLRGLTTIQSLALLSGAVIVAFGISTMRASAGGPTSETRKSGEIEVSMSRLKQLGLATMMYASEHDAFPPAKSTDEARRYLDSFVDDKDSFLGGTKGISFEFNTKLAGVTLANLQNPAETVEWYEKVPNSKLPYVVVYVDGHVVRYQGKAAPQVTEKLAVRLKPGASAPRSGVGLGKGQ